MISADLATVNLAEFMRGALAEAEIAGRAGELPIGAVIVIDGEIVSRGRALHKSALSQVRHAELNAILAGGERLWRDYRRAILLTTLEPCPMCLGAAVMADIPHIVFALADGSKEAGQIVERIPYVRGHIKSYHGGILAAESAALFARYAPGKL